MSELSPQAQAVLDAAAKAMECPDGFLPYELELMAAALRAAAEQIDHDWSAFNCIDALNEIADELENHQ